LIGTVHRPSSNQQHDLVAAVVLFLFSVSKVLNKDYLLIINRAKNPKAAS
jgi:hypothetical protein